MLTAFVRLTKYSENNQSLNKVNKILPVSKETTTLLVNLVPITLKPFGTPFALLTPNIQPTTSANGVRIFRECSRPSGGFLIITYTRPSTVIAIRFRESAVKVMPFMCPDNLPLKRRFAPVGESNVRALSIKSI